MQQLLVFVSELQGLSSQWLHSETGAEVEDRVQYNSTQCSQHTFRILQYVDALLYFYLVSFFLQFEASLQPKSSGISQMELLYCVLMIKGSDTNLFFMN